MTKQDKLSLNFERNTGTELFFNQTIAVFGFVWGSSNLNNKHFTAFFFTATKVIKQINFHNILKMYVPVFRLIKRFILLIKKKVTVAFSLNPSNSSQLSCRPMRWPQIVNILTYRRNHNKQSSTLCIYLIGMDLLSNQLDKNDSIDNK